MYLISYIPCKGFYWIVILAYIFLLFKLSFWKFSIEAVRVWFFFSIFSEMVKHTVLVVLIFDTCTKHVNTVHAQTKNKITGRSPATC